MSTKSTTGKATHHNPAPKTPRKSSTGTRRTAPVKTRMASAAPVADREPQKKAPAAKPIAAAGAVVKSNKEKKAKVIRDSFSIPKNEFAQIAEIKKRALNLGIEVKKSELLRAGLLLISGLNDSQFKQAVAAVPTLKTGRPSKP